MTSPGWSCTNRDSQGDQLRYLVGHVAGVVVLPGFAAHPGLDGQVVGVGDLVRGGDPGPQGLWVLCPLGRNWVLRTMPRFEMSKNGT